MDIVRNNFNNNACLKYCFKNEQQTAVSLPLTKAYSKQNHINCLKVKLDKVKFKYNAILNSSGAHYIILDEQLRVIDFNRAAVNLVYNICDKHIKAGDCIADYLDQKLFEPVMLSCSRALAGESFAIERRVTYFDKSRGWWLAEYSPAYDKDNHIAGIIFNATDITARKHYEDRIELQNAKLRSISLMQSHDIRGPVCTLMGLIDLIKADGNKSAQEYLPMIEDTIILLDKHIKEIVNCAYEV